MGKHLWYKPMKFVFRAIGDHIGIQHLEGIAEHNERMNLAMQRMKIPFNSLGIAPIEEKSNSDSAFRLDTGYLMQSARPASTLEGYPIMRKGAMKANSTEIGQLDLTPAQRKRS